MVCCGGYCRCLKCGCGGGCGGGPTFPGKPPRPSPTGDTETLVLDVAPVKMYVHYEASEMGVGAEGGCKCGPNCKCNPCNC